MTAEFILKQKILNLLDAYDIDNPTTEWEEAQSRLIEYLGLDVLNMKGKSLANIREKGKWQDAGIVTEDGEKMNIEECSICGHLKLSYQVLDSCPYCGEYMGEVKHER